MVLAARALRGVGILGAIFTMAVAGLALFSAPARAAQVAYARVSVGAQPATLKPGGKGTVLITIDVAPDFHINAAKPADPNLIPTSIAMKKTPGFRFGAVGYPVSRQVRESYSPQPLLVYMGKATFRVPVTVSPSVKPGRYALNGVVTYQGCNHSACFPPQYPAVRVQVSVK